MHPLPSRTVPRSAISGFGCRSAGKAAVMHPLPSRTVPRSAISGFGCRSAGKLVVIDPQVSRSVEFISSLLGLHIEQNCPLLTRAKFANGARTQREKIFFSS